MVVFDSCDQPHHIRQQGLRGFVKRLVVDGRAQISGNHLTVLPHGQPQKGEFPDIPENLAHIQLSRENDHFGFLACGRIREWLKHEFRQ